MSFNPKQTKTFFIVIIAIIILFLLGGGSYTIYHYGSIVTTGQVAYYSMNTDATDSWGAFSGDVSGATLTSGKYGGSYSFCNQRGV